MIVEMTVKGNIVAHKHDHGACIDKAVADAERICAERGSRFTELRRRKPLKPMTFWTSWPMKAALQSRLPYTVRLTS